MDEQINDDKMTLKEYIEENYPTNTTYTSNKLNGFSNDVYLVNITGIQPTNINNQLNFQSVIPIKNKSQTKPFTKSMFTKITDNTQITNLLNSNNTNNKNPHSFKKKSSVKGGNSGLNIISEFDMHNTTTINSTNFNFSKSTKELNLQSDITSFIFKQYLHGITNRKVESYIIKILENHNIVPKIIETDYKTYRTEEYLEGYTDMTNKDDMNLLNSKVNTKKYTIEDIKEDLLDKMISINLAFGFVQYEMNNNKENKENKKNNKDLDNENTEDTQYLILLFDEESDKQIKAIYNSFYFLKPALPKAIYAIENVLEKEDNSSFTKDILNQILDFLNDKIMDRMLGLYNKYAGNNSEQKSDEKNEENNDPLTASNFLCLTHHDLHKANILYNYKKKDIKIIDLEFACFDLVGLDIVNFIIERECFDYTLEKYPFYTYSEFDIDLYYEEYVSYMKILTKRIEDGTLEEAVFSKEYYYNLIQIISIFWIVLQSTFLNLSTENFAYERYAYNRLDIYNRVQEIIIKEAKNKEDMDNDKEKK